MLRARTTEDAALQTFWTTTHSKQCAFCHQSVNLCIHLNLESQEGVLSLKTWDTLFFKFFSLKNCCLQTTYIELINSVINIAFASFLPVWKWRSEAGKGGQGVQVPGGRGMCGHFVSGTQPSLPGVTSAPPGSSPL